MLIWSFVMVGFVFFLVMSENSNKPIVLSLLAQSLSQFHVLVQFKVAGSRKFITSEYIFPSFNKSSAFSLKTKMSELLEMFVFVFCVDLNFSVLLWLIVSVKWHICWLRGVFHSQ